MILTLALQALLSVLAGGSAVPATDDESPRVQAEQSAIPENNNLKAKGEAPYAQQAERDRREDVVRHDGRNENSTTEDNYEDAGKGSSGNEPAPESSDVESK